MKAASRRISERTLREKIKRVKSEEDRPRNARTMEAEIMALRFFFFFSVSSGRLSAASLIGVIARFRLGRGLQGDRKEEQRKRKHPEGVKGKGGKKKPRGRLPFVASRITPSGNERWISLLRPLPSGRRKSFCEIFLYPTQVTLSVSKKNYVTLRVSAS